MLSRPDSSYWPEMIWFKDPPSAFFGSSAPITFHMNSFHERFSPFHSTMNTCINFSGRTYSPLTAIRTIYHMYIFLVSSEGGCLAWSLDVGCPPCCCCILLLAQSFFVYEVLLPDGSGINLQLVACVRRATDRQACMMTGSEEGVGLSVA